MMAQSVFVTLHVSCWTLGILVSLDVQEHHVWIHRWNIQFLSILFMSSQNEYAFVIEGEIHVRHGWIRSSFPVKKIQNYWPIFWACPHLSGVNYFRNGFFTIIEEDISPWSITFPFKNSTNSSQQNAHSIESIQNNPLTQYEHFDFPWIVFIE